MRVDNSGIPEAGVIAFSIFWKPISRFHAGLLPSRCALQEQHFDAPVREEALTIDGQTVIACHAIGPTPTHGVSPLEVEVPVLPDNGWLQIGVLTGPIPRAPLS